MQAGALAAVEVAATTSEPLQQQENMRQQKGPATVAEQGASESAANEDDNKRKRLKKHSIDTAQAATKDAGPTTTNVLEDAPEAGGVEAGELQTDCLVWTICNAVLASRVSLSHVQDLQPILRRTSSHQQFMMTTVMFADAASVVSIAAHHVAAGEVSVVVAGHEDIAAASPDDACADLAEPSHSRKKKKRAPAESGIASWSHVPLNNSGSSVGCCVHCLLYCWLPMYLCFYITLLIGRELHIAVNHCSCSLHSKSNCIVTYYYCC